MIDTKCTRAELGDNEASVLKALAALDQQRFTQRIWQKDATLWKSDPVIQEKIKNRLGWLSIAGEMTAAVDEIQSFAASVKAAGFKDLVLLGMGGSSLCPEVLSQTMGSKPGFPKLTVLDTTDPETILKAERSIDLKHTLFILASKSGSTIEMLSLYKYFSEKVRAMTGGEIGSHFIAITDPGSALVQMAEDEHFRKTFLAPPDVGGRYSALTYFGLVPASLIGIDLRVFLDRAKAMIKTSSASLESQQNPAILLGAILGTLAQAGRNKMTFLTSDSLSYFGIWAEQLVAESTGKEGKGIVPIDGEAFGDSSVYDEDRFFVCLRLDTDVNRVLDEKITQLQKSAHPVVQINLKDSMDLAGEFFRWELATAVAAYLLEVNPFDEPNVSESKASTAEVLAQFKNTGTLSLPSAVTVAEGLEISGSFSTKTEASLPLILKNFLSKSGPGDYVAVMAYLGASKENDDLLQIFRTKIRDKYHVATTLGYGPRFLHSTGQLHKGGGRQGRFIQITIDETEDIAIPKMPYSFGTLKRAQALGDFHSLRAHKLPVLDIRLGEMNKEGLRQLIQAL